MNDFQGWICTHRKIENNPLVTKDNDYFRVWIHLLVNATHKEMQAVFKGEEITLKPGQLITGRKKISVNCKINESKAQRILKAFENAHQIEQQNSNQNRLITIVKWNEYQNSEQPNEQPVNNERTTDEQPVNTNNNIIMKQCNNNSTTTNTCESIFDVLQKEFGRLLSPMEYEIVNSWLDLGIDKELIKHAIKESVANEAKSLRYTQRILESYKRKNIKTVSEAQKAEKEFKERREKSGETTKTKKNNWEEEFLNEMR